MASAAYEYAINNQGIDAMYQAINDFLASNPSPAEVAAAMAQYGVSAEDISNASGYSVQEVNNYVAPVVQPEPEPVYTPPQYQLATPAYTEPEPEPVYTPPPAPSRPSPSELSMPGPVEPDYSFEMPADFNLNEVITPPIVIPPTIPTITPTPQPIVQQPVNAPVEQNIAQPTQSAGYTYAQNNQGIDTYYENISKFVNDVYNNNSLTTQQKQEQINNAAKEYGVSNDDIANAMKIPVQQVNDYLAPTTPSGPVKPDNVETINVTTPTTQQTQTTQTTTKPKTITDYEGKSYDTQQLANLALQIEQNFDTKNMSGGAFGTKGESIGFDYNTLTNAYGGTQFSTADQIAFDMARSLLNQGITSYDQLKNLKQTTITETFGGEGGQDYYSDRTAYINPATGQEVNLNFGQTFTGKGSTTYTFDPNSGKVTTAGHSTSDLSGGLGMALSIGASFLLPGVGQILATELGISAAAGTALAQAGLQLAMGADPKSALLTLGLGVTGVSGDVTDYLKGNIGDLVGPEFAGLSGTQLNKAIDTAATAVTRAGTSFLATGDTTTALTSAAGSVVNDIVTGATGSNVIGAGAAAFAQTGDLNTAALVASNAAAYNAGTQYKQDVVDLFNGAKNTVLQNTVSNDLANTGITQQQLDDLFDPNKNPYLTSKDITTLASADTGTTTDAGAGGTQTVGTPSYGAWQPTSDGEGQKRWVEIKDANGNVVDAMWEQVGADGKIFYVKSTGGVDESGQPTDMYVTATRGQVPFTIPDLTKDKTSGPPTFNVVKPTDLTLGGVGGNTANVLSTTDTANTANTSTTGANTATANTSVGTVNVGGTGANTIGANVINIGTGNTNAVANLGGVGTGTLGNANVVGSTGNGNITISTGGGNGNANISGTGGNGNVGGNGGNGNANIGGTGGNGNANVIGTDGNGNVIISTGGNGNVIITTLANANANANILTNANITTNTTSNTNANVNANVLTNVYIPNVNANVTTNTISNLANIPRIGNVALATGGLNPGWITNVPAFYNTTNDVQSKFFWGGHPYQEGPTFNQTLYNTAPNAPRTPWGLQNIATDTLNYQQLQDAAMGKPVVPLGYQSNQVATPVNPNYNTFSSSVPYTQPIVGSQVASIPYKPLMSYQDYHNMLLNQANQVANQVVTPVAPGTDMSYQVY